MTPPVSSFLHYVILLTLIKLGYRYSKSGINDLKPLNHMEEAIYLFINSHTFSLFITNQNLKGYKC